MEKLQDLSQSELQELLDNPERVESMALESDEVKTMLHFPLRFDSFQRSSPLRLNGFVKSYGFDFEVFKPCTVFSWVSLRFWWLRTLLLNFISLSFDLHQSMQLEKAAAFTEQVNLHSSYRLKKHQLWCEYKLVFGKALTKELLISHSEEPGSGSVLAWIQ